MHSALSSLSVVAILVTTLAIQSCSVNPVTGKTELSLMSQQQEIALGSKNYAPSRQSQGGDYYIDPSLQAYVANIGRNWRQSVINQIYPMSWWW